MKRSLFALFTAQTVLAITFSLPAHAQDCARTMISFIQLSDGTCVNASYMSLRGAALADLEAAESLYNQAVELNAERPDSYSYTSYGANSSVTRTYNNELTEEEKKQRQELQDAAFENLSDASSVYDNVVILTTPSEQEAMRRVSGTMAAP